MKSLVDFEINRVSWESLREIAGTSENIKYALIDLLGSSTPDEAEKIYWRLENHVVVQGQLFQVSEFVVPIILAALIDERPRHVKISLLDLLFQIVSGVPDDSEIALGNENLSEKCILKAREGLWLLYREFLYGEKISAQDVIEVIETDISRLNELQIGSEFE